MTTLTTLFAGATTTIETNKEEFVAFIMDKTNKFTVAMVEAELTKLNVAFTKSANKDVKAGLLFDALQASVSAAGETPVAESKPKEEVVMKKKYANPEAVEAARKAGLAKLSEDKREARGMKSLPAPNVTSRKDLGIFHEAANHVDDAALKEMLAEVLHQKNTYMSNLKVYEIIVEEVYFYAKDKKSATREEIKNGDIVRQHKMKKRPGFVRIVGDVTVRIPKGFMLVKKWDANKPNSKGKLGAPTMVPFEGVDLNLAKRQFDMRRPLAEGSGKLVLSIIEFIDGDGNVSPLSVSLPTEQDKTGQRWPIFHTADARFIKTKNAKRADEALHLSDNNANFNAQVTAYVQMVAGEFVMANPENNHSHKKECGNLIRFMQKDGVSDDLHAESKKSRYVQQQVDTTRLSRVGANQPSAYCPIYDIWVDGEVTEIFNGAEQFDRDKELPDANDRVRKPSFDEIEYGGRWTKKEVIREAIINKVCGNCANFCGNYAKSASQINREKEEAFEKKAKEVGTAKAVKMKEEGKIFVSPFMRETAKAKAQAIQTLTLVEGKETWVNKLPQQVAFEEGEILDVRVLGAGMMVLGSEDVEFDVEIETDDDGNLVLPVEEFDARHAEVMKLINQIFWSAFNYYKLDATQVKMMHNLVANKPEMTTDEEKRWDNAVNWFKQAIERDLENQARNEIVPFPTVFHVGPTKILKRRPLGITVNGKDAYAAFKTDAPELHVEDIMGEAMERAEEGTLGYGLGYEDLRPEEFTRYLDEVAMTYVYKVITEGAEYAIVGGTKKEKELAAGALQDMLQKELTGNFIAFVNGDYRDNSFATGIRRSEDPQATLDEFKVARVVRKYLSQVCGLNK